MRARFRTSIAAFALVCALVALTAAGCGSGRKVAAAFLYFRPVLCTISSYQPNGSIPPGATVPVNSALCAAANAAEIPSTELPNDDPTATVLLPYYDNSVRYVLGPADMNGSAVASTSVTGTNSGGYQVLVNFTQAGAAAFGKVVSKPQRSAEAIELNGLVLSAATIQARSFNGTEVISGSATAPLTKAQADHLALVINLARRRPPLSS